MSRLNSRGYQAYLVGGAVRDLLLGNRPKDFDVATDATPEKVRALFGNSRIIGRRFRIVHVRFGREIIEVTTFRGHHPEVGERQTREQQSKKSEQGVLLRDNVFGSLEEDAIRRDFTVNALYYNPRDFCLIDHVQGVPDLQQRQLRIIGEAEQRYREDPVRMVRAIRFSAKLDFTIEADTAAPIGRLAHLLAAIPPARLFDELIKLLMGGYAQRSFRLLRDYGLFDMLFPVTAATLAELPAAAALIEAAMASTDRRHAEGKTVTPIFLFAALLWAPTVQLKQHLEATGRKPAEALAAAGQNVIGEQVRRIAIPRRFSDAMMEIWDLQRLLEKASSRRSQALLSRPRFRAAYDLLLLREQAGEDLGGRGKYWTDLQESRPSNRNQSPRKADKTTARRRRWQTPRPQ